MLDWLTNLGSSLRRWLDEASTAPETDEETVVAEEPRTRPPRPDHGKHGTPAAAHPHPHPVPGRPRTRPPRAC